MKHLIYKSQTSQRTTYPLLSSVPRVSLCSQYFVDSLQISYSFVALCSFLSFNNTQLMLMFCCARWDIDAQETNSHVLMRWYSLDFPVINQLRWSIFFRVHTSFITIDVLQYIAQTTLIAIQCSSTWFHAAFFCVTRRIYHLL
jgi:hypothetical protein